MLKKPTHIQAHLVFADTQSPNKKPKELEFFPTHDRIIEKFYYIWPK